MVAQTLEQWHEILQYMALVGETRTWAARRRRAETLEKERPPLGGLSGADDELSKSNAAELVERLRVR